MGLRIGLLALQGASAAHGEALTRLGVECHEIRQPKHLLLCDERGFDGLVIPGGESTTISMQLENTGLFDPLKERIQAGLPVLGTCAGMILLSKAVTDGRSDQRTFDAIDLDVRRNGYGRQVDSFEADLEIDAMSDPGEPFRAVFIRAPMVERVGADVEVLATARETPVLCRTSRILVSAFHPELTPDLRVHEMFCDLVTASQHEREA